MHENEKLANKCTLLRVKPLYLACYYTLYTQLQVDASLRQYRANSATLIWLFLFGKDKQRKKYECWPTSKQHFKPYPAYILFILFIDHTMWLSWFFVIENIFILYHFVRFIRIWVRFLLVPQTDLLEWLPLKPIFCLFLGAHQQSRVHPRWNMPEYWNRWIFDISSIAFLFHILPFESWKSNQAHTPFAHLVIKEKRFISPWYAFFTKKEGLLTFPK